jgi:hypothetical protein
MLRHVHHLIGSRFLNVTDMNRKSSVVSRSCSADPSDRYFRTRRARSLAVRCSRQVSPLLQSR